MNITLNPPIFSKISLPTHSELPTISENSCRGQTNRRSVGARNSTQFAAPYKHPLNVFNRSNYLLNTRILRIGHFCPSCLIIHRIKHDLYVRISRYGLKIHSRGAIRNGNQRETAFRGSIVPCTGIFHGL